MKYRPLPKPRGCLSCAQVVTLLDAAAALLPSVVPLIALQLFAAVRRSELCSVRVNTNGILFLIGRHGELRRILDSPNLGAWLRCYPVPTPSQMRRADSALRDIPRLCRVADVPFEAGIVRRTALTFAYHRRMELGCMMMDLGFDPPPPVAPESFADSIARAEVDAFWNIVPPSGCPEV